MFSRDIGSTEESILFIGEEKSAFSDNALGSNVSVTKVSSIVDALQRNDLAKFSLIAVEIGNLGSRASSVLKAIRDAASDVKILLLARMYQEPAALDMVKRGSSNGGRGLADDYLICPVATDEFLELAKIGTSPHESLTVSQRIIEKQAKKIKQLERLSTEDELTNLKNRRYFWEFARQLINMAKETQGQVTLLIFDIDNFKHYNDLYGHAAGDEILREASLIMKRCCRSHDLVGRIGGDEFAVLFWDEPKPVDKSKPAERRAHSEHPRDAIVIARRFRQEMSKAHLSSLGHEGRGVLTISGGLASYPTDAANIEELFDQADEALLDAKRSGKNRIYLIGDEKGDIDTIKDR